MGWTGISSLRIRLLVLVLLAALPAIAVIIHGGMENRREVASAAELNAARFASSAARAQSRLINSTRQLLILVSRLPQLRGLDAGECSRFLADLLGQDDTYANFGVILPNGQLFCSALPFSKPLDLSDREYFQLARTTRSFSVGPYMIGRVTHAASINMGYPIMDHGQVKAVLFAALPLTWLSQHLAAAHLPEGTVAAVFGPGQRVLARYPNDSSWAGRDAHGTELQRAIRRKGGTGTARVRGLDGVERLYAFNQLYVWPNNDALSFAVGIPTDTAYAAANAVLKQNLLVLLGTVALTLMLAWWGGKRFVLQPIEALLTATRRITNGELEARAPVGRGSDELSQLAGAFNRMAQALQNHTAAAQDHTTRIARQNRVYAVLSGINSAILRIRDESELLEEACRIAVEHGHFRFAWVGRIRPGDSTVVPVAMAGEGAESFPEVPVSADPALDGGQGPTGIAIREARHVVINDVAHAGGMGTFRQRAGQWGFAASAAFPLTIEGRVVGSLTLHATEPFFFDEEEVRLLLELAADTSLGMEYIEKETRLEHLAYFDHLTGLPNRRLFEDRLDQSLPRAKKARERLAVAILDINGFRQINDTLGHHVGDEVLQHVGNYLRRIQADGHTAARLGNDEFGLIFNGLSAPEDAARLMDEVLAGLPGVLHLHGDEVFLTAKAGIAVYPLDGRDSAELAKHAELALHARDGNPGNSYTFHSAEINTQAHEQRLLESQLRHALERREFALEYQPVVDLHSCRVQGVEALLRWNNPTLGQVSPARFIPIAEETGLIVPIGLWVLQTACAQAAAWRAQGHDPVKVAVNVSVRQLHEPGFVQSVREVLSSMGIEDSTATPVGIEITESQLMRNTDRAVAILSELKAMGLALSIDDFGTGYSSLSYLKLLPIDNLKIDLSFIRDLSRDPHSKAVVRGIVALAHSLDLRTIAEGVEMAEQWTILEELACDAVQGYLIARPLPADEVVRLFGRTLPPADQAQQPARPS